MSLPGTEVVKLTVDILKGVNQTIWGGAQSTAKASDILKTGVTSADLVIGTSHALEDFSCNDRVCGTISIIGSASSSLSLILGNIPKTKPLTKITGSITVCCRSVRYYCKNYGTYWGCTVAASKGVKEVLKYHIR